MAPRNTLYRLAFGGRLNTNEGWSCSLHFDGNQLVPLPATAFQAALSAWITRADSKISNNALLDFIKFNRVAPFLLPTGRKSMRYADPGVTVEHQQLQMAFGTTGGCAGQDTVAVSLKTAKSRGRAHIGRIYPPTGQMTTDPEGRLTAVVTAAMASSAATLIRDLNAVVAAQGTTSVVVYSVIGDVVENVQTVAVGRVVDTMRSRRASLVEEPSSAPVNP